MKAYLYVSATVFVLIAGAHLLRAIRGWEVILAGGVVPVGASWLGAIVAGALAAWGLLAARSR